MDLRIYFNPIVLGVIFWIKPVSKELFWQQVKAKECFQKS